MIAKMTRWPFITVCTLLMILGSCKEKDPMVWKSLEVKVSAYNSVRSQTDGQPNIAAWGDTLKPGMRCVAVSRDLIPLGLGHNTPIKIVGIDSIFLVKDKMHPRWKNQIDIYMGEDVEKAKNWGKRKLVVQYVIQSDSLNR